MTKQNESAEVVKDRILKVSAELFAEHGIKAVSIRRIAEEAEINHALIIRYFGTKDALVTEILHREIRSLIAPFPMVPGISPYLSLENLRASLLSSLSANQNTMRLIVRTGLEGLSPEQYVGAEQIRAANLIAQWIKSRQTDASLPDAKLISLLATGTLFSLVCIAPWMMTSVGLPADDYENKKSEIIDTIIWMIARAAGLPPENPTQNGDAAPLPAENAHKKY